MTDFEAMRRAYVHAAEHGDDCSCALQKQVSDIRAGMNIEDWTPAMHTLFARIEQLEAALDEVGNALVSIIGNNNREWGRKHTRLGTDVLLNLAEETYENVRSQ
jgi:hypothetical protein